VGKQNRDENDAPYLGLAPSRPQHQKEKCLAKKHEEVDACILFDIVLYHDDKLICMYEDGAPSRR